VLHVAQTRRTWHGVPCTSHVTGVYPARSLSSVRICTSL